MLIAVFGYRAYTRESHGNNEIAFKGDMRLPGIAIPVTVLKLHWLEPVTGSANDIRNSTGLEGGESTLVLSG